MKRSLLQKRNHITQLCGGAQARTAKIKNKRIIVKLKCLAGNDGVCVHPAALHLLPLLLEEHPTAAALAAQMLLNSPAL
jgi:hypothetical protein